MQDTPLKSLTQGRIGAGAAGVGVSITALFIVLKAHGYVATPEEVQAWIDIALVFFSLASMILPLWSKYRSVKRHKGEV